MLDDAEAVRNVISPLAEAGHQITVFMHSAGGFITSEGINGMLAPELKHLGKVGDVTSLVFVTAPCMSIGEETPAAPWYEYKARGIDKAMCCC